LNEIIRHMLMVWRSNNIVSANHFNSPKQVKPWVCWRSGD